jgi:ferredoxin
MSQTHSARRVMVIGAASETGVAVRELAALGYAVQWLTAGDCPSDTPATCFPHSQLVALEGQAGAFTAVLAQGSQREPVPTAAVIVATGNQRVVPAICQQPAASQRLLTVPKLLAQLDVATANPMAHVHERLLFLLDWQGESSREGAFELLQAALRARRAWRAEVFVFYRDLKVDSHNLEALTRDMRELGIVFCRYGQDGEQPQPRLAWDDDSVSLTYVEGTLTGDLLILPEEVAPAADTAPLAAALQIHVGEDGYFQDVNIRHYRPGLSNRRGVFLAGRCHADLDAASANDDALLAVSNVAALLSAGDVQRQEVVAHVDEAKCIRCLTCLRSCPHAAVEIVAYPEEQILAARILSLACEGCGTCISNCPVRAIAFEGQLLPAWMA